MKVIFYIHKTHRCQLSRPCKNLRNSSLKISLSVTMLVFWLCYQICRCSVLIILSWHTCDCYEFESSITCIAVRGWHSFLDISKMQSRVACYFVWSLSLVVSETYIPFHVNYQCVQDVLFQDSGLPCFYQGHVSHRRDEKISLWAEFSFKQGLLIKWYCYS